MATWEPTTEDILRVLREQNPWHEDGSVPRALAPPVERSFVAPLYERLTTDAPRRYQLVLGHRRVGKTTVMYHLVNRALGAGIAPRRLWWLRLDHPLLMEVPLGPLLRAVLEVAGATPDQPAFVFLDEVVYAHDWDLWLKTFYDERWPICLVATSSATAALRERRAESGVGRWEEQHLTPYLLAECLRLRGEDAELPLEESLAATLDAIARSRDDLAIEPKALARRRQELMLIGGFPELLFDLPPLQDDDRSAILLSQRTLRSDAVERAIYKDIPQSFGIDSPLALERVLYVLAGQMTGLLSPTNIARDLGISQPTFDRYLGYLEQAFLVFALPNYSGRESTVQRRGRKVYFVDGAVRNAALQRGTAPLGDEREMGVLRENLAASHLNALAIQTQVRLFHWRAGQREVDFVYDHPDRPLAFEVASSPDHSRAGLRALLEQHPRFAGGCYVVAPGATLIAPESGTGGIGTLPFDTFLLAVSRQAEAAADRRLAATLDGGPMQPAEPDTASAEAIDQADRDG